MLFKSLIFDYSTVDYFIFCEIHHAIVDKNVSITPGGEKNAEIQIASMDTYYSL